MQSNTFSAISKSKLSVHTLKVLVPQEQYRVHLHDNDVLKTENAFLCCIFEKLCIQTTLLKVSLFTRISKLSVNAVLCMPAQ